jgi:hypothetical protein
MIGDVKIGLAGRFSARDGSSGPVMKRKKHRPGVSWRRGLTRALGNGVPTVPFLTAHFHRLRVAPRHAHRARFAI